jgi:hypothetical protein
VTNAIAIYSGSDNVFRDLGFPKAGSHLNSYSGHWRGNTFEKPTSETARLAPAAGWQAACSGAIVQTSSVAVSRQRPKNPNTEKPTTF